MTGKQKRRLIDTAIKRFGDQPSLEKTLGVAVELYPQLAAPDNERSLRAWVSFELSEAYKQNRFLRAAAMERGLRADLTIRQIRDTFGQELPDEHTHERSTLPGPVGPRTSPDARTVQT